MRRKFFYHGYFFFLTAVLFLCTSCSFLSLAPETGESEPKEKPPEEVQETGAAQENQTTKEPEAQADGQAAVQHPPSSDTSSVYLMWKVPDDPVERYHIEYGTQAERLEQKITISAAELERVEDPVNGALFRYVIHGIAGTEPVFFTIQAENKYGLSPKSAVQEVR